MTYVACAYGDHAPHSTTDGGGRRWGSAEGAGGGGTQRLLSRRGRAGCLRMALRLCLASNAIEQLPNIFHRLLLSARMHDVAQR